MNFQELLNKLTPQLHEVTVGDDIVLYVRKPTLAEFEKCTTTKDTLIHCVCDETGYQVFADGDEEGKFNINQIDSSIANELFQHCLSLWQTESISEEVEKK